MIKLFIIGNLTKDPELRTVDTKSGKRNVANFTVASNGRREGDVTFIRVSVWDKLADVCSQYLSKGRKVFVGCSSLSARTYTAQDGTSRISIEATANEVEFLSQRNEGEPTPPAAVTVQASAPEQPKPQAKAAAPVPQGMTPVSFSDDDLPF